MRKYFFPAYVQVLLIMLFLLFWMISMEPSIIFSNPHLNIVCQMIVYTIPSIILGIGLFYNTFIMKLVNVVLFIVPAWLFLIFAMVVSNNLYNPDDIYAPFILQDSLSNGKYEVILFRTRGGAGTSSMSFIRQQLDIGFGLLRVKNVYEVYRTSAESDLLELNNNTLRFINPYGNEETLTLKPHVYF